MWVPHNWPSPRSAPSASRAWPRCPIPDVHTARAVAPSPGWCAPRPLLDDSYPAAPDHCRLPSSARTREMRPFDATGVRAAANGPLPEQGAGTLQKVWWQGLAVVTFSETDPETGGHTAIWVVRALSCASGTQTPYHCGSRRKILDKSKSVKIIKM